MPEQTTAYGISVTVPLNYATAVEKTRAALAHEGFGVLTEIDVRQTMKQKLGAEFRPYLILGACNPPLALKALTAERDIGLLLPCNLIVYATEHANQTVVAAMDPVAALGLAGKAEVEPLAHEVKERLERVLSAVARN
jgi:uncharacterized protein (DUF302 family)